MTRTRRLLALGVLAVALSPVAAQALPSATPHAVVGSGSTFAGSRLEMRATDAAGSQGLHGLATWRRLPSGPALKMTLDCLVVGQSFAQHDIQVPPGKGVFASGVGNDRRRYFISISAEMAGADLVAVTTRRGSAPCDADPARAVTVASGSFTVVGRAAR